MSSSWRQWREKNVVDGSSTSTRTPQKCSSDVHVRGWTTQADFNTETWFWSDNLTELSLHSCLVEVIYRSVKSDPSCQRHSHFTLRLQSLLFGAINHSEKKVQLQTSSLVKPLWKWRSVCLRLANDGAWQEPDSRWLRICIFFSLLLSNQTFVPSGLVSAPLHHEDSKVFVCYLRNWQSRGDTNDPPCSSRAAATWRCVRS